MKKYINPNMEIKSFAAENIVTTASSGRVDEWNETNGYNAKKVDWNNLTTADISIIF